MEQLKLKKLFQQELIASIIKGTSPKTVKNKNKGKLVLDSKIVEHIRKSRLKKVNNNDEMENRVDDEMEPKALHANEMDHSELKAFHQKDQNPKAFHAENQNHLNVIQANEKDDAKLFVQANEIEYFRKNKKRKLDLDTESSRSTKNDFKEKLISEFDRIYDSARISIYKDTDESIGIESISDEKIKDIYYETMKKDYTKWKQVKLFIKLTKSKNIDEIVKILGLKKENFRKKLEGFKKVDKFLSYLHPNDFCKLDLCISYFQKISIHDWNEVLRHLEMDTGNNE